MKKKELQTRVFRITDVYHFNPNSNWFVAETDDGTKVVGTAILPPYGRIETECEFREDNRWGDQYFVHKIKYESIEDIILPLLASGFMTHVREVKAHAIVETLGVTFFSILEASCAEEVELYEWEGKKLPPGDVLTLVKGIGKFTAEQLIASWKERRFFFRAAIDAIRCELTPREFKWAISRRGHETFTKIVHNEAPWNIYDLLFLGLEWDHVDKLALDDWEDKPALTLNSPIRMAGAVKYALAKITDRMGHMCAPESDIYKTCLEIGIVDPLNSLDGNMKDYGFVEKDDMIYSRGNYEVEEETAIELARIITGQGEPIEVDAIDIDDKFSNGMKLSDEQVVAVQMALKEKVSVITGGPGVGKTTVLKVITNILQASHKRITLCAPTGNAARRMKASTGLDSWTLHRYFYIFLPDPKEQNPCTQGWLIIDEMSMTSSKILRDVLRNVYSNVHVVFVGDVDQLPPVGSGEPLLQIIESGVPVTRLTKIFRQGEGSQIIQACHDINNGIMPTADNRAVIIKSLHRRELAADCMKAITWLTEKQGAEQNDIQVLSPINKDSKGFGVGQIGLNNMIRDSFNPEWKENETPVKGISVHDRVIQCKNNYDLGPGGIMNGQVGQVIDITKEGRLVLLELESKEFEEGKLPDWANTNTKLFTVLYEDDEKANYSRSDAIDLKLAYAMTIHKSQGGQFPYVIMIVPRSWHFNLRQLIYTGASRAQKILIILEESGATNQYVENDTKLRRYSLLSKMIKDQVLLREEIANEPAK